LQVVAPVVKQVKAPGELVTVYPVIELPPMTAGAAQVTLAEAGPEVAVTPVGGPGTAAGVTGEEAADAGPVPTLLVAVTVKAYDVPLARPDTVQDVAPIVVHV
jgi:hypothetical protein